MRDRSSDTSAQGWPISTPVPRRFCLDLGQACRAEMGLRSFSDGKPFPDSSSMLMH